MLLVLFFHHVDPDQQPAEEIAQDHCPVVPDIIQLIEKGIGIFQRGLAKVFNDRHPIDLRLCADEGIQLQDELVVIADLRQMRFIKKLARRFHGRGIAVRDPQDQDLFNGVTAVFQPLRGFRIQILIHRLFFFHNTQRGKLFAENLQRLFGFFRAQLFRDPRISLHIHLRSVSFAILIQQCMHDLIQQPQGIDLARIYLFETFFCAYGIDLCRELTHCPNIGKDHIPVI